jgi:hypothetical protein
MIGESLSGTGSIGWRARVNAVWAAAMIPALIALVSADGIRGAAWAHAALFGPFACAYVFVGARRLGLSPGAVLGALRPVVVPVAVQVALTAGVLVGLETAGIAGGWAAAFGACAGLACAGGLLARSGALSEAQSLAQSARTS